MPRILQLWQGPTCSKTENNFFHSRGILHSKNFFQFFCWFTIFNMFRIHVKTIFAKIQLQSKVRALYINIYTRPPRMKRCYFLFSHSCRWLFLNRIFSIYVLLCLWIKQIILIIFTQIPVIFWHLDFSVFL